MNFLFAAVAGACLGAGTAFGECGGDSGVAGEWIFEPEEDVPGWAVNSGGDGGWGNLGLIGGAGFSTNVPGVNCGCGHSLELPGTNGAAGAVSVASYDPLAGAEKFSVMAWVRRGSEAGENLSARIFSDADSTALADTTAGVEFRFSGSAGNLALRINGTEVATTVGGVAPESGEWHHVAAVYDGTRAATNYATRNVHFYVDGVQKGVGSVLQGAVVASNDAPVVVGNASAARTAGNLLAGNVDDVLVIPGWAPEAAGNGNASAAIQCFMAWADDIFPPGIAAPPDIEADANECLEPVAVELGTPTVWDDCQVVSVTNDAPALFPLGTNVVTWTVCDEAGNVATCTQTVTVVPSSMWDCDGDGLADGEEIGVYGTDWHCRDTDGDELDDGDEAELGTNPLVADSDSDGLSDGEEAALGTNPLSADSDGDGVGDAAELLQGSNPANPDSDGDGWTDGEEAAAGTEAMDSLSAPRLARGVLLHAVKYSASPGAQWVLLHCSGPRAVDVSGFRIQAAGTNWETQATLPPGTWMRPGHFLLVGGEDVENADVTAELDLPGSYANLPTAGVRLTAPENSTNAPVDVLMYGTHVPFNEQGLDTTGWLSETTNLWASSTRHLERWSLGQDTDRESNWRHVADSGNRNSETVLDSDGDGLTDEEEYLWHFDPLSPDMDGDGLLDGFELDHGLDPTHGDTDGDGTPDGGELDPDGTDNYIHTQGSDGLKTEITVSPSGWSQGDDLGLGGVVEFTLSELAGFAVWGTVWEGGAIPEGYTVAVEDAAVWQIWETTSSFGHKTVNVFAAPAGTNAMRVVVTDASWGAGVTNEAELGADIRAAFQAMQLDVRAGGVGEDAEESPGVFCVNGATNASVPRTPCVLSVFPVLPKMDPPLPGTLALEWGADVVAVYPFEHCTGGTPLAALEVPLDGFSKTNLWMVGIAPSNTVLRWGWNGSGVPSASGSGRTVPLARTLPPMRDAEPPGTDKADVHVVDLWLKEVRFAGETFHEIRKDDDTASFAAPHWLDNSSPLDGDADDEEAGDRQYPVCYTRNSKMSVSAKWSFAAIDPSWTLHVRGTGPDGLVFPMTEASISGTTVSIADVECTKAFPNKVACWNPLTIAWQISWDGGGNWADAGASENPLYVTLADPKTTPYHTLVHLGCANADGKSSKEDCVAAIWADFTDLDVRRADGTQMVYWGTYAAGSPAPGDVFSSKGLLKNADGRCGAWANFFQDLLLLQGMTSIECACIRPSVIPYNSDFLFLGIKNWDMSVSPPANQLGIAAQGNPDPNSYFFDHIVVRVMARLYDPSYGQTFDSLLSWEDSSVEFFDSNPNHAITPTHVIANLLGNLQTTMTDWSPEPENDELHQVANPQLPLMKDYDMNDKTGMVNTDKASLRPWFAAMLACATQTVFGLEGRSAAGAPLDWTGWNGVALRGGELFQSSQAISEKKGIEEQCFEKVQADGTRWSVSKTENTVMRPAAYSVPDGQGQLSRKCRFDPCVVFRFALSKTNGEERETVWTAEESYLAAFGAPASGMTPHESTTVWDVAETDNGIFVLCSRYTHLRVDVQKKNAGGQWECVASHSLGEMASVHFSGRLHGLSDGVEAELIQGNAGDAPARKICVVHLTEDGVRECPIEAQAVPPGMSWNP